MREIKKDHGEDKDAEVQYDLKPYRFRKLLMVLYLVLFIVAVHNFPSCHKFIVTIRHIHYSTRKVIFNHLALCMSCYNFVMYISSVNNAKVKDWVRLQNSRYRNETGTFLVEGEHLIEEAERTGLLTGLIYLEGKQPLYQTENQYEVNEAVMKKISTNTSLNSYIGICKFMTTDNDNISDQIIVLDNIQDPANIGGIIRTALALGYRDILLSLDSVDMYNEKLIKASQGAIFHLNVVKSEIREYLLELKKKDYKILATDLAGTVYIEDLKIPDKYALIFGNEGQGIGKDILALADICFKIPLETFDSLNVLSAASICLYELKKEK